MNKFIQKNDKQIEKLGKHLINSLWWSRKYEYAFCENFINENETVLDVGCGIEHPLKYHLADKNNNVYAIDIDDNIKDLKYKNITFINDDFLNNKDIENIKFDKIFIISTLSEFNFYYLNKIFIKLENILKDDGKIIITNEYPKIDVTDIIINIENTNLIIDNHTNIDYYESKNDYIQNDYTQSENDLLGYLDRYKIFTMVLRHKNQNKEIKPTENKVIKPKNRKSDYNVN